MSKAIKTIILSGLLTALPLIAHAQDCKTSNVPATTPTSQFIDYKNGTVMDRKTGLVWKKCAEGQTWNSLNNACTGSTDDYTWQDALQQAQTLNTKGGFAGQKDWRVPNIKELASIFEMQCARPAINLTVFKGAEENGYYWSSTPRTDESNLVWRMDTADGKMASSYKDNSTRGKVRLVCAGRR